MQKIMGPWTECNFVDAEEECAVAEINESGKCKCQKVIDKDNVWCDPTFCDSKEKG